MGRDNNDLSHAFTPQGVAYRENGLRNLEAWLLAKRDWATPQEREKALAEFYELAARLRAIDAAVVCNDGFNFLDEMS